MSYKDDGFSVVAMTRGGHAICARLNSYGQIHYRSEFVIRQEDFGHWSTSSGQPIGVGESVARRIFTRR